MLNKIQLRLRDHLEEVLSEDEMAIIWAALNAYDVGPKEADPELYEELEESRKSLLHIFE